MIPDWISIESHASLCPSWKGLCLKCQSRRIGKKRECIEWAEKHEKECKGAVCEKCGTMYKGLSWDRCPACGYCINDI